MKIENSKLVVVIQYIEMATIFFLIYKPEKRILARRAGCTSKFFRKYMCVHSAKLYDSYFSQPLGS